MTGPFEARLAQAREEGLLRRIRTAESRNGPCATIDGRELILFSSNDYLGLSSHPSVVEAACQSVRKYGWGSGAARLICGAMPEHKALEEEVARFLDKEAALMFNTGYAANTGALTSIIGRGGYIFADKLCHASIIDGAMASGARLIRFRHNDPESLEHQIRKSPAEAKRLVVTEGVFSMDGDTPPLADIAGVAKRYGAMLMVDDAHGFGLFGPQGRGTPHMAGVQDMTDIHVITLGKAAGGFGGVIAASRDIIEGLINYARTFIYSTALPPAVAAAALAGLGIINSDEGEARRKQLFANTGKVLSILESRGYKAESNSQIIPLVIGENKKAKQLSDRLLERGIFVPAIRPPTVPKGTARLRFSISCEHTAWHLQKLDSALG